MFKCIFFSLCHIHATKMLLESASLYSANYLSPYPSSLPPMPSASMPLTLSQPLHFVNVKLLDLRDLVAMHKTCHTVLVLLLRPNYDFPLACIQSAIFFDFPTFCHKTFTIVLCFGFIEPRKSLQWARERKKQKSEIMTVGHRIASLEKKEPPPTHTHSHWVWFEPPLCLRVKPAAHPHRSTTSVSRASVRINREIE